MPFPARIVYIMPVTAAVIPIAESPQWIDSVIIDARENASHRTSVVLHPQNCAMKKLLNDLMPIRAISECDIYADSSPYELLAVVGGVRINAGPDAVAGDYIIGDLCMDSEVIVEPIRQCA